MSNTDHSLINPFDNPFPAASREDWLAKVHAVLKGADFEKKLVNRTHDGLRIEPLYSRHANAALVAGANAGKPWQVCARVDHPEVEAAAAQARDDLEGGADALALVFPGGRSARGYGIACDTVADLDAALAGVHLDLVDLRLDPAQAGRVHALSVAALVEKRKLNPASLRIDFGMDPIGSLLLHGQVPWDWSAMAARLGETVTALMQRGFKGPFLTVDLRPYHEAGASEGQELAVAMAQGVLYLRALEAGGLSLHAARKAISFIMPVDGDQFLGIATLRALRKLWAQVETVCGLTPEPIRINAETSWRMLTKRDPHVNILRASVATFAAAIGGADSITVLPFTQSLGLPEAEARRLARNTSIVMMEESNLWRVVDPAAGAGGYEALAEELCAKAWSLFQEIEAESGLVQSLVSGALQSRIAATKAARLKAVATRREPITGTSEFANLSEVPPAVLNVAPSSLQPPKARLKANHGVTTPDAIAALLAGANRAEVAPPLAGSLRAAPLVSSRISEPFEALRDQADAVTAETGKRPEVMLLTIGALADHAARLAFTRNFFEVGGFAVSVVSSLPKGKALLCLVGSDATYAAEAGGYASQGIAAGHKVWLAGRPGELVAALTQAGVSRFVFAGCDVVEALMEAQNVIAEK
ncbi:MAG: methylmalonyl-CoA mutase family protein [Beijerinckiaceae bacterium]